MQMRQHDDDFAQQIYQAARRNFTHNLKDALDARDAWYQEKVGEEYVTSLGVVRVKECGMLRQPGPDVVSLIYFAAPQGRMGFFTQSGSSFLPVTRAVIRTCPVKHRHSALPF